MFEIFVLSAEIDGNFWYCLSESVVTIACLALSHNQNFVFALTFEFVFHFLGHNINKATKN